MIQYSATYTDLYEITMAQAYYVNGMQNQTAVFDYFFRRAPFDSGYAVFAGLENLLDGLAAFKFEQSDLEFLRRLEFREDFLRFLEDFRFSGKVYSSKEGDVVFPYRPILQLEGNIIEAQLVETLVLNILNFQTLIATKASRTRLAAPGAILADFGMRRAQGPAAYYAARASYVGGFDATSNVTAGKDFGIPVVGTMAHSFVQSFDEEIEAFRAFAKARPEDVVLLVDTYDTLGSGIPNAIAVAKELESEGKRLKGIRLDSGDLSWLAKEARKKLDEAGLGYVKIAASNELDETVVKSLKEQHAPIDIFGVGTKLVIGKPDGALDGVYKLSFSNGKPRLKLSETLGKISLPHKKQVFRAIDKNEMFSGADVCVLRGENLLDVGEMFHPREPLMKLSLRGKKLEPLLEKVMENGLRTAPKRSLSEIKEFSQRRLLRLPDEYKRFENPCEYKVGLSEKLLRERDQLVELRKVK